MNGKLFPTDEQLCTAKILIIDDEQAQIKILEWALRQAKFPGIRSLSDSTKALEAFKEFKPDLVLLDLYMPQLDGFEILKLFREATPADEFLPVLALTGQNTSEVRSQALDAGASDFLGKPIDYTEVMLRIRNLLQTRFLYQQARETQRRLDALTAGQGTNTKSGPKP
jgi:putative two-component system response regulator